jgi:hypothetical protein
MALSSQFALQKVFSVFGYDIDTGELILTLKKMKETKPDKKKIFEYAQSEHLYKDRYLKIIKELCV